MSKIMPNFKMTTGKLLKTAMEQDGLGRAAGVHGNF
jgi:hypothetical protein